MHLRAFSQPKLSRHVLKTICARMYDFDSLMSPFENLSIYHCPGMRILSWLRSGSSHGKAAEPEYPVMFPLLAGSGGRVTAHYPMSIPRCTGARTGYETKQFLQLGKDTQVCEELGSSVRNNYRHLTIP